ncbi:MAG: 4Fe-4S binding protein [Eggerthellaceae bacterium]|jgi:Pyruvate/2-oxoacid:ferredoxin oxidoreductase delta subunit
MEGTKPGIDYDKLRNLGVPEEVIASLDPRDGGNITPDGQVLYLDEERLKRRECSRAPYKNHPTGLGIADFLYTKVLATTPDTWERTLKVFMMIVNGAKLTSQDTLPAKIYKRITRFEPEETSYSHGNVMPLNVSVEDEAKTSVMPIDLIFEAIDHADYIGQMDRCICRSAHECTHYDKHIGCLFFNMAGVTAVKNGLAHPVTKDQAKAHVYEARDAGLVGQALYVELEQMVWGFRNDRMDEFLEICFCCPCCCVAMDVCRNANRSIKNRFSGSGYTMVAKHDKCKGCGKCIPTCPQEIITKREDGKVVIDQEHCMGCGCCKSVCENDALELKMTMPMRESLHEYFLKEGSIDMNMEHCTLEPPAPDYQWHSQKLDPMAVMQTAAKTAADAPAEIAAKGPLDYVRAHPVATGAAAFGVAALAHVVAHRR